MKSVSYSIIMHQETTTNFEEPFQITTAADLPQAREALKNLDVLEWVRQRRPNSKWVVDTVTNITFFITKIPGHPIGRGTDVPVYLAEIYGLVALDRNARTIKIYTDNVCFFQALALHNGCHTKNLDRYAKHYFERLIVQPTRQEEVLWCQA